MEIVIAATIVSVATAIITAAFVTLLGCCSFKVYIEREVNRILDEHAQLTEGHVAEVISLAKSKLESRQQE